MVLPTADWLRAAMRPPAPPVDDDQATLHGAGPAECSSSRALSVVRGLIWDVNRYYRELGVSPYATRKDLRLAYYEANGQASARLTYVIKQLLNPEVRKAYDATPLGEVFMDDYVYEIMRKKIKAEAFDRWADLHQQGHDNVDFDAVERDVMHGHGMRFEDEPDTPAEVVDSPSLTGKTDTPAKFYYSHYLWGVRPGGIHWEGRLARLADWQRLLVRALSEQGLTVHFAVGLHGKDHNWLQGRVGYRTVFMLNHTVEPTEEMAAQVAALYAKDHRVAPAPSLAITTQR